MADIRVYPDAASLARAAAELFVTLAAEAIAARRRFAVALSGGSTPRVTYALLADDEFATRLDWPRVHVFWGDERCIPPDDPESNFRLAEGALLSHVPIPPDNVHRVRGELEPEAAAQAYAAELRTFFGAPWPRFDLVLLGMGADGHTASLFPGTTAVEERERAVVAVYVERLRAWRVTLTLPVINAAHHVLFLVTGATKAETLQAVLEGPDGRFPAQQIRPASGHLIWLVDVAAASQLKGQT